MKRESVDGLNRTTATTIKNSRSPMTYGLRKGGNRSIGWRRLLVVVALCLGLGGAPGTARAAEQNVLATLGDSITYGLKVTVSCRPVEPVAPCLDGTAFPDVLARALLRSGPWRYQNLGLRGARTASLPSEEVPKLVPDATLVVVYVGRTDEIPIARGAYSLDTWKEDFAYALAAIRERAPHARLIVATLVDAAYSPGLAPGGWDALPQILRTRVGEVADDMNAYVLSLPYDIVDLRCDPKMYDASLLATEGIEIDPYHFGDRGDAYLAGRFYRVAVGRSDPRSTSCRPYTSVPPLDRWYVPFKAK